MPSLTIPANFQPRHYQLPLFEAMDNGYDRAFCVWHRRSGKDKSLINLITKKSFERVGTYLYLLPTYVMGRGIIWRGMDKDGMKFLDHIPEAVRKTTRDQEMEIELENGSVIKIMGAEDPDRLRGINPVGVVFSEYAFMKPNVWDIIRPILVENGGWAVFNTTPNGKNHAYDQLNAAQGDPKFFTQVLGVGDTQAISEADIDRERKNGMSEEMIMQEFYCSFDIGAVGTIWGKEMAEANKQGRVGYVPYQEHLPVITAWDLGRADATAVWFAQIDRGKINIIDYYQMSGSTIEMDYRNLTAKGYPIAEIILPHDAAHHVKGALTSVEQQVRNTFYQSRVQVLARGELVAGIRKVRSLLHKCFFDEVKCAEGIRCLENYKRRFNRSQNRYEDTPLHDENSHGADSLRYLLETYKDIEIEEPDENDLNMIDGCAIINSSRTITGSRFSKI